MNEIEMLGVISDQGKTVSTLAAELCGLRVFHDRIMCLPHCNNCGLQKSCKHMPDPGQDTRINCPLWMKNGGAK